MQALIPTEFFFNLVKLQFVPRIMVVCWQKSKLEFLKLNTDGIFDKDKEENRLGGILRDEEG